EGYWNGDSLQFALDPDGTAMAGNQVEFVAVLDGEKPVLMKNLTPYLGGDLPTGYSQRNEIVRHARIEVDREPDGRRTYRIRIESSELFPFALNPSKPLRFSLLINNNDGQGRSGYLEWGSGIGADKDAAKYGTLLPLR
ncbi:MAG: hypothetical protein U1E27_08055, partial [Kiritimatiellia bacterium]|nr:hypothetical protein [Kiritimatiellia bacterium]